MAAAEGEEFLPPGLPELFDTCQRLLDEVEVAAEPSGSRVVQEKVLRGLHLLKQSAEMLLQLDLFRYRERAIADNEGTVILVTKGGAIEPGWRETFKTSDLSCLPPTVISCALFTFSTSPE